MKMITRIALCFAVLCIGMSAFAQSASEIKARMKARHAEITELKKEGTIKEAESGYLEYVPGKVQKKKDVVEAENADRKKVYAAIAKQQGTTVDKVAKIRGEKLTKE